MPAKIAFVGASGYGNVGDDTYPLVFSQQLPGHELFFYNSDLPAHLPDDIDVLVLGGGGILYNNPKEGPQNGESPHFRCMRFYIDAAIRRGIPWGILSCGFQFRSRMEDAYAVALEPWVPYLRQAHFITLRSPNCLQIASELGERGDVHFFPDAAYLFHVEPADFSGHVTIVPAGAVSPGDSFTDHCLRQFTASGNALVWLGMGADVDDRLHLRKAAKHWPGTQIIANPGPKLARACIASSRFVLSGRYHGMVFARASKVPFLTAMQAPYKIMREDYAADITTASGHFDVLRQFIE